MTDWLSRGELDEMYQARNPTWLRREMFGEWADMTPRCDCRTADDQCLNVATLDVLDPEGEPTGTRACAACSKAHPNLRYRPLRIPVS